MKRVKIKDFFSNKVTNISKSFSKLESYKQLNLSKSRQTTLVVDFSSYSPVSIISTDFYNKFLTQFKNRALSLLKPLGIERILFLNYQGELLEDECAKVTNNSIKSSITVSAFSYFKLLDSLSHGYFNDSSMLYIVHSFTNIETYIIDKSCTYKDLIDKDLVPNNYYFMLTGITPDKVTSLSSYGESILSNPDIILEKNKSFLFPFPLFNREVKLANKEYYKFKEVDCINCNMCNKYCPESILPQYYYHYLKSDLTEECEKLNIDKCTKCGICSFVCPSNIPIKEVISKYFLDMEVEIGAE